MCALLQRSSSGVGIRLPYRGILIDEPAVLEETAMWGFNENGEGERDGGVVLMSCMAVVV